jgi:hypothetical protein
MTQTQGPRYGNGRQRISGDHSTALLRLWHDRHQMGPLPHRRHGGTALRKRRPLRRTRRSEMSIELPLRRVVGNVFPESLQFDVIANDAIVVALLPDG